MLKPFKKFSWELTMLSGVLIGFAYQPWKLGFLVYVGFIPIILVWMQNDSIKNFKHGYLFGFVYNLISNYWIGCNSGAEFYVVLLSLLFAAGYLAIFWGACGFIIGALNKKKPIYYLPFLIVTLEWIRSFGPLGFDWGILALTQIEYLPLLQLNSIFGPYFSTFIIISTNLYIYIILNENNINFKKNLILIFSFSVLFIYGSFKKGNSSEITNSLNIAVIQPNLDPKEKWNQSIRKQNIQIIDSLYSKAISLKPDFILFPETAYPTYLTVDSRLRNQIQKKVNQSNIPILVGTVDRKIDSLGNKLFFNSTIFMKPEKNYDLYSKIHLVPFAEYDLVPEFLHPLMRLNLNIDRGIFVKGEDFKVFEWNGLRFSDLICYESSFARYSREFSKRGAKILMIQANDGWLGNSAGPHQHFSSAILRAIENNLPVVRSGNTGISGVIYPSGIVKNYKKLNTRAVFMEKVPIYSKASFYSQYGDFFAIISFVIFLFLGPVKCAKN